MRASRLDFDTIPVSSMMYVFRKLFNFSRLPFLTHKIMPDNDQTTKLSFKSMINNFVMLSRLSINSWYLSNIVDGT